MRHFPAFLDLKGKRVVIAGGGDAARAKARLFASAGADLLIVDEKIEPGFEAEFADSAGLLKRRASENDFVGAVVAIVAKDKLERNEELAEAARRQGALVNVVDAPALCDFQTPSIIDRGRVVAAISTGGAAPVLAQRLRAQIEALLPARIGALADFADSFRAAVKGTFEASARRRFWARVFDGPIAAAHLAGDEKGAHDAMLAAINRPDDDATAGVVHIVGAGPGDPELLTLKAHRILQDADVVLYDRLVGEEVLALTRRDAERVFVGKAKADHSVPQEQIEALMIAHARAGRTVVRLKGGDPFVFGRGGEELDALRSARVRAYVTPGVTAATGCAAAAGMALTHRNYAQAVTFVTGHAKGDAEPDLDWAALAALRNTLVVYMGVAKAAPISARLIEHGRDGSTPVAIVENGTLHTQKVLKGRLDELGALVEKSGVKGPAVLVIGEVAALADGKELKELVREERLIA